MCVNKMASSLEIIHAQKRGRRIFKPLVKEGANVNIIRHGRRIREHFSPAEDKYDTMTMAQLRKIISDNNLLNIATAGKGRTKKVVAAEIRAALGVDHVESKINKAHKRNTADASAARSGEMKEAPPKIVPRLLRSNTEGLDESCSRFFGESLPDFVVTGKDTFEIEDQQYKVLGKLGEGTYGLVINAQNTATNEEVAVKFMFGPGKKQQKTELAMQYYLACMLESKPPPPGSALVPRIYTIADLKSSKKKRLQLDILKTKNIKRSLVGVMEKLDSDLETLFITKSDDEKIPIVKQALCEITKMLKHVNEFSSQPVFVHGDLHTGNVMYTLKGNKYQFYMMDLGMSEIVHYGGRTTSPNRDMYNERTPERWRHLGSKGNDLCMLCLSIVEMFKRARLDELPELFEPIRDYFATSPEGYFDYYNDEALLNNKDPPLEDALDIFLDETSEFYLGCNPRTGGRWPLGMDANDNPLPLFHYYGYDNMDEDEDVTDIFAPAHFLQTYLKNCIQNKGWLSKAYTTLFG